MAELTRVEKLNDASSNKCVERKDVQNGSVHHTNTDGHTTTAEARLMIPKGYPNPVNLTWENLSYSVHTGLFHKRAKKFIVQDLTGSAPSGKLTVILGPSGAGKTTLLSIISGFKGDTTYKGDVLVNGEKPSPSFYRENSCYIPQETYLYSHLTVLETLSIAADLKLPLSTPKTEKRQQIDGILEKFHLMDVKLSRINQLSGGEKKRLMIAQDLVSNPPIILLDEPTSGLDSSLSFHCISLLSKIASDGRTVVCTIHQPSSSMFELFDNLHVLSKGRCIYTGLREDLTSYLSSCGLQCPKYYNPADYIIDVASGVRPGEEALLKKLSDITQANRTNRKSTEKGTRTQTFHQTVFPSTIHHSYATSPLHQFLVLNKRLLLSTVGQPMLSMVYLLSLVLLAALIGTIYRTTGYYSDYVTSNLGLLALVTIIVTFTAVLPTLLTFPSEKLCVLREYHNGWYSVNSYYFAKTIAELPFNCILPFIFTTTIYWLTSQPNDVWRYVSFVALAISLSINAQSITLIVGALCSRKVTVFLVPAICLILLLFCNFFSIRSALPSSVSWISYLSPFALFYKAILILTYGFDRKKLPCKTICLFTSPTGNLNLLNIDEDDIYMNVGLLCGYIPILRILGYICLNLRLRLLK